MAYSEAVLRRAKARLAAARAEQEAENDAVQAEIYGKYPRLKEIDRQLSATAAKIVAATFRSGGDPAANLERIKAENLALQRERAWILEANELDEADLEPTPICPACGGTGYVGAVMCACLKELCRQEQKKELSSLLASGRDSFDQFRLDVYSDQPDPDFGVSPRQAMTRIYGTARRYAREFSLRSGNLLLSGGPGLGKTFLSACIARTVTDGGWSVVYETAVKLFSDFEAEKFENRRGETEKYTGCDLLIIDDLGTEMTTQFIQSALYTVVNTRLMAGRPTVISTNLSVGELQKRYSPQIYSRIRGSYELLWFFGDDLRLR